jgi:hypothetical protein
MTARQADYRQDGEEEQANPGTEGVPATPEASAAAEPESTEHDRGPLTGEHTVDDDLAEACRDYSVAVHHAWVDATQAWWRAYTEFAAAQHRAALDGGLRRTSAYHAWFRTTNDPRLRNGGGNLVAIAYETYHRAIAEAAKAERSEWEQAHSAYLAALSAANETYNAATQSALKAYLGQIREAWGRADIDSVDAEAIARLARAGRHAAQIARSLQWGQR